MDKIEQKVQDARALFQQRKVEEAEVLLQEALSENPHHPGAHHGLGLIFLTRGDSSNALPHFQEAQRLNPSDPAPVRAIASLWRLQGQPQKAVQFLEGVLIRFPILATPIMMMDLAELYAVTGQNERLTDLLARLEQGIKMEPALALALGELWKELGDHQQIERLATSIEQADGGVAAALLGSAASIRGDHESAIAYHENAVSLSPGIWHSHAALASLLVSKDLSRANHHAEAARNLAPQTPQVRLASAIVDIADGRTDPGKKALEFLANFSSFVPSIRAEANRLLNT